MNEKKAIIALLVENNANVLSRVSMLFGRRGYNIDSLTVSETNDPTISRITITTQGDDRIIEQIVLQTRKLVEVKAVQLEDENEAILRELL
ncbi:MAG: acetolactate synthase small subunit, partial [Oscillospiraceae bacterium]